MSSSAPSRSATRTSPPKTRLNVSRAILVDFESAVILEEVRARLDTLSIADLKAVRLDVGRAIRRILSEHRDPTSQRTVDSVETEPSRWVGPFFYLHRRVTCGNPRCRKCRSGGDHGAKWFIRCRLDKKQFEQCLGDEKPKFDPVQDLSPVNRGRCAQLLRTLEQSAATPETPVRVRKRAAGVVR